MFTDSDFKGAKAVVTGAANGIGKGFAENIAKRGSDVLVVDIHGDEAEAVAKDLEATYGVKAYGQDKIIVKVKYGAVCVCGCGLELLRMTREQLVIRGRIDGVTLQRRG